MDKLLENLIRVFEAEEIEYFTLEGLLPCPYNREIDRSKVDDIKQRIKETGIIKPFVVTEVNAEEGPKIMITDGHHRYLAMQELIKEGDYKIDVKVPTVIANEGGVETAKDNKPEEVKEGTEYGIGYEPLIKEFIEEFDLTDKQALDREKKIKAYYKGVLDKSGNVKVAYEATRKWCNKIFVQAAMKKKERDNKQLDLFK